MDITNHDFGNPNEPVYLLSLDGGGIRGISEAVILHEIMKRVQTELGLRELPRPCDYFHLIGGTSTGGLIAIMLGRLRMTTQQVLEEYETMSEKIFHKKNRRFDRSFKEDMLVKAIKTVAKPIVGENAPMVREEDDIQKGECFVVSLKKGGDENTPTIFRSYKCHGEEEAIECQLWEAARATTAAPSFFAPTRIKVNSTAEYYVDGAIKWNNPSLQVVSEAEALFGPHRRLGCMVSLGTGIRPPSMKRDGKKGRLGTAYSVSEIGRVAMNYLTDPEPPDRQLKASLKDHINSYFRFSVPAEEGKERVRIFEYQKMGALRLATERYIQQQDVSLMIDQVVEILCRGHSTNLTLEGICRVNSPETALRNMNHWLHKRQVISETFTGRENILNLLDQVFAPREPASYPRRDFRLWGAAGMGKTQIALRFMDLFHGRFQHVFWIDATDATTIHYSFETIADKVLTHPGKESNIPHVIQWLEDSREEWLLVVDHYDHGNMIPYLPGYRKGNILFTSRRDNLKPQPPLGSTYQVTEMSMADSTLLLLRASRRQPSEELAAQAQPLIEELGSLPLAISQAGSHISMNACTFGQYLDKLRREKKEILSKVPDVDNREGDISVYASFELSWDSLKSFARGSSVHAVGSQSALQILNTFCFYHSQRIPIEMVLRARLGIQFTKRWGDVGLVPRNPAGKHSPSKLAEGTDAAWIDPNVRFGIRYGRNDLDYEFVFSGLMTLLQFSLLTQPTGDKAEYSVQPLIHSWLRDRMLPGTFDQNLRISRSILYHSYHRYVRNAEAERFYPSLLPHMKANNSHQFKSKNEIPFMAGLEINWKYLQILKRSHRWEEAVPLLEQDIATLTFEIDRNNWRTLNAMIELGKAYMATGRIVDAEDVFHQVLDRTRYCPSQAWARKSYVHVCSELSMVYLVQGSFGPAQMMAETAVRYAETRGINAVLAMARLCLVYQYLERWKDALALAHKVLRIRLHARQKGPEHHATLKAKAEVAYIRARLGYIDAAEAVLTDVAKRFEVELGRDHHDTLVARTNLAWVHFAQFRLGEAEVAQREILAVGRAVLGQRHLYTLYMMLRLGLTLGESGKFEEAIELLDECVEGRIAMLWEIHPAVGGAHVWRSVFMSRMEGYDYAADISEADVEVLEKGKRLAENPYTPVQI